MPTTAVLELCPMVERTGIASRDPVRGVDWRDLGAAANHLLGRGGVVIPATIVNELIAKGATATYRIRLFQRYQASHRIWFLHLKSGGVAEVTFTPPSGTPTVLRVGATAGRSTPTAIVETVSWRTSVEAASTFTLACTSSASLSDATFVSVSCVEVPRPELAKDANDYGVDLDGLGGGLPIYFGANESVGGVVTAIGQALTTAKRNCLLALFRGVTSTPLASFNSTSFVNPFASDPVLIDRQLYRSETRRAIPIRAYGRTGAGTTMELRFTMASGDSKTLSWAAADAGSWKSDTLLVHVEDLSTSNGIRSGIHDTCTIEGRRPAGASTAAIDSIFGGGSTS